MKKNIELRDKIFTIVRTIADKFDLLVLDFSEPYIFNCPPNVREDLYLNKIMIEGTAFSIEGITEDGRTTYTISETNIDDKYLEEIADWLSDSDTYEYVEEYFSNQ